jgi:nicotinamide mononucleotide transporter
MNIGEQFIDQLLETTALEFIAVSTGILSVWFSKQEKIWVYPVGIISVGIYVYLTLQYRLYADTGINAYYLGMSIFGWYNWKNTREIGRKQIPITKSSRNGHLLNFVTFIVAFIGIFLLLSQLTDSDVPKLDALTTSLAVTAMYLMALKKIEHWYYWIACDIVSIGLYAYKGLIFTSFQFVIFTYIAILGSISWNEKLHVSNE